VVVVPNYRLYPEVKSPAFIEDIAHAVKWAHDHAAEYDGDANRLFLMGHSAGAQIAAMISYESKFLLNAGGQSSWIKGFIGLAGPYDFLPFTDEYLHDVFGPPANYPQSQPINFVSRQAPRTLLIHGEADTVVAPKNSKNLAATLRAKNVAVTEFYYPSMGHSDVIAALSVYFRNRRPLLHEIAGFIAAD
jgi:acetyl esterase/lipase